MRNLHIGLKRTLLKKVSNRLKLIVKINYYLQGKCLLLKVKIDEKILVNGHFGPSMEKKSIN